MSHCSHCSHCMVSNFFRALAKGSPIERRSPRIAHLRLPQHLLIVAGRRHPPDFWGNHWESSYGQGAWWKHSALCTQLISDMKKVRVFFGTSGLDLDVGMEMGMPFTAGSWSRLFLAQRIGVGDTHQWGGWVSNFLPDFICTVVEAGAS